MPRGAKATPPVAPAPAPLRTSKRRAGERAPDIPLPVDRARHQPPLPTVLPPSSIFEDSPSPTLQESDGVSHSACSNVSVQANLGIGLPPRRSQSPVGFQPQYRATSQPVPTTANTTRPLNPRSMSVQAMDLPSSWEQPSLSNVSESDEAVLPPSRSSLPSSRSTSPEYELGDDGSLYDEEEDFRLPSHPARRRGRAVTASIESGASDTESTTDNPSRVTDSAETVVDQNLDIPNPILEPKAKRSKASALDVEYFFSGKRGEQRKCLAKEEKCSKPPFGGGSSTTTLRDHLLRHHKNEYSRIIRGKGWAQYYKHVGIADGNDASGSNGTKIFLPPFSTEVFENYLVQWIAADDQSINVVECPEFRALLTLLKPNLQIPHRTKMRKLIITAWYKYFVTLKADVASALGRPAHTIDIWTDGKMDPHMAITGHYLVRDENSQLHMRSRLFAFHRLKGNHSGERLARIAIALMDRVGSTGNVFITLDNASNNDTFMECIEENLLERGIFFNAKQNRIRCFAHIINIAVQHILAIANPPRTPARDQDPLADDLDSVEQHPRNPLAKIIKLITAVRSTGQRRDAFRQEIISGNERGRWKGWNDKDGTTIIIKITPNELLMFVKTRWDSSFYMLRRARMLKQPLDLFVTYGPYCGMLANLKLTDSDWKELQDLEIVLGVAHHCQQLMSSSRTPLLAGVIPSFELLMTQWERLGETHNRLARFTEEGLKWANKYYKKLDDTDAHVVAMFIHPCIRLSWIRNHWEPNWIKKAERIVMDLMTEYRSKTDSSISPPQSSQKQEALHFMDLARVYNIADLMYEGQSSQNDASLDAWSVKDELRSWCSVLSPVGTDPLAFYSAETTHKTILAIALDYLPIQATSVPCEQIFSSSSETDTKKRNRTHPLLNEALQMLKYNAKASRRDEGLDFMGPRTTNEADMLHFDEDEDGDALGNLLTSNPKENILLDRLLAFAVEDDSDTQLARPPQDFIVH